MAKKFKVLSEKITFDNAIFVEGEIVSEKDLRKASGKGTMVCDTWNGTALHFNKLFNSAWRIERLYKCYIGKYHQSLHPDLDSDGLYVLFTKKELKKIFGTKWDGTLLGAMSLVEDEIILEGILYLTKEEIENANADAKGEK